MNVLIRLAKTTVFFNSITCVLVTCWRRNLHRFTGLYSEFKQMSPLSHRGYGISWWLVQRLIWLFTWWWLLILKWLPMWRKVSVYVQLTLCWIVYASEKSIRFHFLWWILYWLLLCSINYMCIEIYKLGLYYFNCLSANLWQCHVPCFQSCSLDYLT